MERSEVDKKDQQKWSRLGHEIVENEKDRDLLKKEVKSRVVSAKDLEDTVEERRKKEVGRSEKEKDDEPSKGWRKGGKSCLKTRICTVIPCF